MAAASILVVLSTLTAWLGWNRRIRDGFIASLAVSASIAVIAAFGLPLPGDLGAPWMFTLVFVVLAGVSLASLGLARALRGLLYGN